MILSCYVVSKATGNASSSQSELNFWRIPKFCCRWRFNPHVGVNLIFVLVLSPWNVFLFVYTLSGFSFVYRPLAYLLFTLNWFLVCLLFTHVTSVTSGGGCAGGGGGGGGVEGRITFLCWQYWLYRCRRWVEFWQNCCRIGKTVAATLLRLKLK